MPRVPSPASRRSAPSCCGRKPSHQEGALLLRSEAIASSRIEGYELSQRNLARALIDPRAARGTAKTVAANVVALEQAIAVGERQGPLLAGDVLAIHRTLMPGEPERVTPGQFRRE